MWRVHPYIMALFQSEVKQSPKEYTCLVFLGVQNLIFVDDVAYREHKNEKHPPCERCWNRYCSHRKLREHQETCWGWTACHWRDKSRALLKGHRSYGLCGRALGNVKTGMIQVGSVAYPIVLGRVITRENNCCFERATTLYSHGLVPSPCYPFDCLARRGRHVTCCCYC